MVYLRVERQDLRGHAHLQHAVHDQLAVGRQQVPPPVEIFQLLHPLGLTDWGSDGRRKRAGDSSPAVVPQTAKNKARGRRGGGQRESPSLFRGRWLSQVEIKDNMRRELRPRHHVASIYHEANKTGSEVSQS